MSVLPPKAAARTRTSKWSPAPVVSATWTSAPGSAASMRRRISSGLVIGAPDSAGTRSLWLTQAPRSARAGTGRPPPLPILGPRAPRRSRRPPRRTAGARGACGGRGGGLPVPAPAVGLVVGPPRRRLLRGCDPARRASRERGRRRSAYEASERNGRSLPSFGGAESKRRRRPRSRGPQSRLTLLVAGPGGVRVARAEVLQVQERHGAAAGELGQGAVPAVDRFVLDEERCERRRELPVGRLLRSGL